MIALHVGLRRSAPPLAIVGDPAGSPRRVQTDFAAMKDEIISRPPVLLIHGDMDMVVPPDSLELSAKGLQTFGIDAETHMSHGIGDYIDQDGLQRGGVFPVCVCIRGESTLKACPKPLHKHVTLLILYPSNCFQIPLLPDFEGSFWSVT